MNYQERLNNLMIYVKRVLDFYNLKDYTIEARFRKMTGCWGRLNHNRYHKTATIHFSYNLLDQSEEKQCHTATHEALHIIFPKINGKHHHKKFINAEEQWLNSYGLKSIRKGYHVKSLIAADKIVWKELKCN